MKLIQFLLSVSLAQLSSIRVRNSPNLEPPDCNQIHSARRCEIQVVWMKPSFWAITWIFSVEEEVCDCHPQWHPRPQSRHTQRGCGGQRGWELLLPQGGGADGGADCNSGSCASALRVSKSSCHRENPLLQCTHCTTFTFNGSRCTIALYFKRKKKSLEKNWKESWSGSYVLHPCAWKASVVQPTSKPNGFVTVPNAIFKAMFIWRLREHFLALSNLG